MLDIIINDIDLNNKFSIYISSNIYHILFKLQKKIYEASKKCHLSLVHGLQKLLLSLSSIKFLAKNIIEKTLKIKNTITIKVGDTNSRISKTKSNNIDNKEINKKIIYWLLESEWNAKMELNNLIHKNIVKKIRFLHKIEYTQKIFYLRYESIIFPKFIHENYLITKLQSFSWINKNILIILKTEYCLHNFQSLDNPIESYNKNIHFLFTLICKILYIGFNWISFRQITANTKKYYLYWEIRIILTQSIYFSENNKYLYMLKQIIRKFLNNLGFYIYNNNIADLSTIDKYLESGFISFHVQFYNLIKLIEIKPSTENIKKMQRLIKNIVYAKDKLGKIKAKTYLSLKQVIYKLNKLLNAWKQYFSIVPLSKSHFKNIVYLSNEIIYRWMKKKYKRSQLKIISLF